MTQHNKDAYGRELWNHYNGNETSEIVERDDGYIDVGPGPKLYFAQFKDWTDEEKNAIKFVKGRVLDIGCGAGRHSLYLQKKGHDVTSIDKSALAIKICRIRGLKKSKVMDIANITSLKPRVFDTILMLGNNFGLFGSFKKARRLLKSMHEIASEDAVILAGSLDPYKTNEPDHLAYHSLNKKKGRMAGQVRIRVRFKRFVGYWFDYLFVSRNEMVHILEGTGWKVRKFIDSRDANYVAIIVK